MAAALLGWQWWSVGRFRESTDNAYIRSEITPISARISGYVSAVLVTDNQRVEKGATLLVIQPAEYEARIEQARADLATSHTELEILASQRALQASIIAQAEAEQSFATAELARAEQALKRIESLIERGVTTRDRHESAVADALKADAAVQMAGADLATAHNEYPIMDARRHQLEATIKEREADLTLAEIDFRYTEIQAPVGGVIGNRSVREGQYIRPGAQLMALVPLDNVWVVANFKETQLTKMKLGQRVEIDIDSYPDHVLIGTVESFSPASGAEFSLLPPQNASGNFNKIVQRIPVKITLEPDNPLAGRLRPGMSVVATVITGTLLKSGAYVSSDE
ncbi:MAG: HlyD family secretion protein [Proteobacteria bacterium]|nr:HlyD family secretion protein [Pseudomonadota bacterium]MDA1357439.1 HlyD family secretion protein [Pseudomonadota bacterium]